MKNPPLQIQLQIYRKLGGFKMLDIIRNDRPVNIKDLAFDHPKSQAEARLPFDPERDIPADFQNKMLAHYSGLITGGDYARKNAVLIGQYLNLLFPSSRNELMPDKLWEESKDAAQGCFLEYRKAIDYFPKYAGIKHFFPNRFSELPFPDKLIEGVKRIGLSPNINVRALSTKGFNKRFSSLFGLGILDYRNTVDQTLQQLEPPTPKEVNNFLNPEDIDWPDPYAVIGLRAFYPMLFEQARSSIDWDNDLLGFSSQGDAIELATTMMLMAAEEVRIDESGLTINLRKPQPFATSEQRLPERRRF